MIDLHPPTINNQASKKIKKCFKEGWVSTSGRLVNEFEKKICTYTGSKFAIACNTGTSALHISLKLAVDPGDEVITPTITFIATVNSIIYNSCSPVFMDCDEFFNIDVKKTLNFLNKNTVNKKGFTVNKKTKKRISAIIVTHVWGNAVDFDDLLKACKNKNIKVIEDASESLGTFYKKNKKHTGTLGLFGVLSFNANKIITTGGGGMILTNNYKLAKKAKYLTTQAKDDPVNFIHNSVGYNYRMTNISAAIGLSQLSEIQTILKRKKWVRNYYLKKIKNISNFFINNTPKYSINNNWLNILRFKGNKTFKHKMIEKFLNLKINARPIWLPNHLQKPFKKFEKYKIQKAIELSDTSLCLPSAPSLKLKELNKIISVINE